MSLTILKEKENNILKRKEYVFETIHQGSTPNNETIKKAVAEATKTQEDNIVISKIHQVYGTQKIHIYSKKYQSPEDLKKIETINKKPKKAAEEKK